LRAGPGRPMTGGMTASDTLDRLWAVLQARKVAAPPGSYVARLYEKGPDYIAQKVGEEAVETALEALRAARGEDGAREAFLEEGADLLFHLLALLASLDAAPGDILSVLERRLAAGGHKGEVP
jgi:phosphoribosyl-ATP pyrophosphohydrolase